MTDQPSIIGDESADIVNEDVRQELVKAPFPFSYNHNASGELVSISGLNRYLEELLELDSDFASVLSGDLSETKPHQSTILLARLFSECTMFPEGIRERAKALDLETILDIICGRTISLPLASLNVSFYRPINSCQSRPELLTFFPW